MWSVAFSSLFLYVRVRVDTEFGEKILYLARTDVQAICQFIDSVSIIREVFRAHGTGKTILPNEAYLGWLNGRKELVRSLNMPGCLGGPVRIAGTKIINSNPMNPRYGLNRANGLVLLFNSESAKIECILEAAFISALRTASTSQLAVELLASPDAQSVTVLGTGVIGRAHLEILLSRSPMLDRIILFDVNQTAVGDTVEALRMRVARPLAIEISPSAEEAVCSADIVVATTTVNDGYIPYDWLKRGSLVVNVSLDDLLPDVFLNADLLFVDDWELVKSDSHRQLGRMSRDGRVCGPREPPSSDLVRAVDGEIGDLVVNRHPGRRTGDEIIVVNPFGMAIEDLACAACVVEIAKEQGIGKYLDV
jgi:N-[(2S)-2-amino-2-carboxyethyl]-L-glutamate dehydrogenase